MNDQDRKKRIEEKKGRLIERIVDLTGELCEAKNARVVIEKNGLEWDWGQALTRAVLGVNWSKSPEVNNPEIESLELAIDIGNKWLEGIEPDWVGGYR